MQLATTNDIWNIGDRDCTIAGLHPRELWLLLGGQDGEDDALPTPEPLSVESGLSIPTEILSSFTDARESWGEAREQHFESNWPGEGERMEQMKGTKETLQKAGEGSFSEAVVAEHGSRDEKTAIGAQSYSTATEMPPVMDKDHFIGLWFVELGDSNYLATLDKSPGGEIELHCRFRHYVDDKIGSDSEDVRHFRRVVAPDKSEAEFITFSREIAAVLAKLADTSVFEIMMDEAGFDAVIQKMQQHPAFHFEPCDEQLGPKLPRSYTQEIPEGAKAVAA